MLCHVQQIVHGLSTVVNRFGTELGGTGAFSHHMRIRRVRVRVRVRVGLELRLVGWLVG